MSAPATRPDQGHHPDPASPAERPLSLATITLFSLPAAGVNFTFLLLLLYLVNYSTDVLLIAPAVIGSLFGLARLWEAASDPIAGYLSDGTRARAGRRLSWLRASALPIGLSFFMLWSPPSGLSGIGLAAWMGVALFAYATAYTVFAVPHDAMAAELTSNHHDRTRLFGVKHLVQTFGSFAALGAFYVLTSSSAPRETAVWVGLLGGGATAATILLAVTGLRERAEYQGRGSRSFWKSLGDVGRNPHARLLLIVFLIESLGSSALGVLTPYAAKYVVKQPEIAAPALACYFLPNLAFPYLWIRLSRRFGKKRLWLGAMATLVFAFGGLFFLGEGDGWLLILLGTVAGIAGSCGAVVGPSVQADVIDYDEYLTGERKEGAYFAVWSFVRKSAYGVTAMISLYTLQIVGFSPNVEQSEQTRLAILALYGLFPGCCFLIGTVLFSRFSFNEAEHARVCAAIAARAGA